MNLDQLLPDPVTFIDWDDSEGYLRCSWCNDSGFYLFNLHPSPDRQRWLMVRSSDGLEIALLIGDEATAKDHVFRLMLSGMLPRSNQLVAEFGPRPDDTGDPTQEE